MCDPAGPGRLCTRARAAEITWGRIGPFQGCLAAGLDKWLETQVDNLTNGNSASPRIDDGAVFTWTQDALDGCKARAGGGDEATETRFRQHMAQWRQHVHERVEDVAIRASPTDLAGTALIPASCRDALRHDESRKRDLTLLTLAFALNSRSRPLGGMTTAGWRPVRPSLRLTPARSPQKPAGPIGLEETRDVSSIPARDRLIVALDLATVDAARALVQRLGTAASFYKIGLELVMAGGLDLARELTHQGAQVFLDMKLLDIENTVERATRNARQPRYLLPCMRRTPRPCAPPSPAGRTS